MRITKSEKNTPNLFMSSNNKTMKQFLGSSTDYKGITTEIKLIFISCSMYSTLKTCWTLLKMSGMLKKFYNLVRIFNKFLH